jgi:hypothetical protein
MVDVEARILLYALSGLAHGAVVAYLSTFDFYGPRVPVKWLWPVLIALLWPAFDLYLLAVVVLARLTEID